MPETKFITQILTQLNDTPDPFCPQEAAAVPDRREIVACLEEIRAILFPSFYGLCAQKTMEDRIRVLYERVRSQINAAYLFAGTQADTDRICHDFFSQLPRIKELLTKDIQALYDGDPAAKSKKEVVLCYPGFWPSAPTASPTSFICWRFPIFPVFSPNTPTKRPVWTSTPAPR